ncbi:MAG: metallophosphoesterase [Promethearchaeota archaeon]
MEKLSLQKGKFPIILKPNFGQPVLLNLRDFQTNPKIGKITRKVLFDAIVIAYRGMKSDEILQSFHLNSFIQPILKKAGNFKKRRGERIPLQISEIIKINPHEFDVQELISEEKCILWDMYNNLLKIEKIFGKREDIFKITFQIKEIHKIQTLLQDKNRSFLLFDIIHEIPNQIENKINYHSLAIFDKDWNNFKFIHATDFHVARRNDFILKSLKDKTIDKIERFNKKGKNAEKIDNFILKRDFEYRQEFQKNHKKELRFAKYNFNYNLRKLIYQINEKVEQNDLDFVLLTGDLIDYFDIARGTYDYENNFMVFKDILLGVNKGLDALQGDDEFINKEEIIAPIFTIVGNHDYRKGHYSIRIGNIRRIFGFSKKDVNGYYDFKFFNYFKALHSKDKFLKDYYIHFNPNLNYRLTIGENYQFIFIDTGHDSVADMHDLLKGGPSTRGIKDYQVDLIRSYIKLSGDNRIIIVMHTPPISPSLSSLKKLLLRFKFRLKRPLKWSDFYEHNLKNYTGSGRLEKLINLKYQTIMYNWATFLKICVGSDKIVGRKVDLILCGHTHTLKEFRLKEARQKESINLGFYFAPIIINVPCEVYTNRYRAIFKSFRDLTELKIWYDVNKPFIFQTQAIGPISLKFKFKPPGYRLFTIKGDQIIAMDIYSLHLTKETKL